MRKQHLNAFPVATRLLKRLGLDQRPGNITGLLIDAARNFPLRRLWTAFGFERATAAIMGACARQDRLTVVDQFARRRKCLAGRTGVDVALLVEREVLSAKGPIAAFNAARRE